MADPNDFQMSVTIDSVTGKPMSNVVHSGRKTQYQRVGVNTTISAASGSVAIVVNVGLGTRALNVAYKMNAGAGLYIYPCDAQGNALFGGTSLTNVNTGGSGALNGGVLVPDWGGAPNVCVLIIDKSALAGNVIQFIDVWSTLA
jgi:hypothetical protein